LNGGDADLASDMTFAIDAQFPDLIWRELVSESRIAGRLSVHPATSFPYA
jgi:hypothetical protein